MPEVQSPAVEIRPVASRRDLVRFLELPAVLYADDAAWVPPLLFERLRHLDFAHNPFFAHADAAFSLGRRKWKSQGGYPTLTHGGLSLLEVAVPFIELSRTGGA